MIQRADDDPVNALHHRRLDIGGLLRGAVLPIALDRLDAERVRLRLELLHHVHEEGKGEARPRGQDDDVIRMAGRCRERQQRRGGGTDQEPSRSANHYSLPLQVFRVIRPIFHSFDATLPAVNRPKHGSGRHRRS
jgi:hypothetical protein